MVNELQVPSASRNTRDEAFPHSARLTIAAEFELVLRTGVRLTGTTLVAHVLETQTGQGARLGLTISRKVGGAVVRNRVRRRLREIFRRRIRPLCRERDMAFDLVIRVLPGAVAASQEELHLELGSLLGRWERRHQPRDRRSALRRDRQE